MFANSNKLAGDLNQYCSCSAIDAKLLSQALQKTPELCAWAEMRTETHPHLFASTMVFISDAQRNAMQGVVSAVHELTQTDRWVKNVLQFAPEIASTVSPQARGVFLGFDFHLQAQGAQLIEINTNAGGALLNGVLAKAQKSCCAAADTLFEATSQTGKKLDEVVFQMFLSEWMLERKDVPLRTVAIVDEQPMQQFLAPEFLLFQSMFERYGIHAVIADPSELSYRDGQLWHGDLAIDLVYNRLTDFYLDTPQNKALLEAYRAEAIVLTPHPRAHAVFASKRNLIWFSSEEALIDFGASPHARQALLAGVPHTKMVTAENAEQLWEDRKHNFFKPLNGFGSRAAYRGDKLTQRVWQEIQKNDYVAQALVTSTQRLIHADSELKVDIRAYVYEGVIQLFAARLYQGQTTNMRTQYGGFAPVFSLPV